MAIDPLSRTLKQMFLPLVTLIAWQGASAAEPAQGSGELLAYDEIGRVHIKPPVPSPDSFTADASRIASLPALPDSKSVYEAGQLVKALGSNPLTAFAVAPAAIALNAAVKTNQAQVTVVSEEYLNAGVLRHVWFYRDWSRIEAPALHSASIMRPDLGATYFVDLAKRTFREQRTPSPANQGEETYAVSASEDVIINFEKAPVHSPIGVMLLSGIAARGYRTEATFTLSSLLGWCPSGRHALIEVEYVVDLVDPQTPTGPALEGSKLVREACLPSSAASHREPGRLVLFRSTAFTGDGASADFVNVLERGNLHAGQRNNESLFSVPANFTKVE